MRLNRFYVYVHRCPDTGSVFYVGKGTHRERRPNSRYFDRAYAKDRRNRAWQEVVARCPDYQVEIVGEFPDEAACVAKERELIAEYGRRDLGAGALVNLCDGGEGLAGYVAQPELRAARSKNVTGERHPNWGKRLSPETCRRKSVAIAGSRHHLHGKPLTESWRRAIAEGKTGERNPQYGRTGAQSPVSKRVRNLATGVEYGSIAEAARVEGIGVKALYQYLDGTRKNPTSLVRG